MPSKSVTPAHKPTQSFAKIMGVARLCAACVGFDILNPNFKFTWISYITISSIIGYFLFSFYTIAKLFHEDWAVLLEALCMVGSVIQGASKVYSAVRYRKYFVIVYKMLQNIYAKYELEGNQYVVSLHACAARISYILKVVGIVVLLVALSMVSAPIFYLLYYKRRIMIMHFHLPLVDVTTTAGYFGTVGAQFVCMFAGSFGNYAGDMFVLVNLAHSSLFGSILHHKIATLNSHIDKTAGKQQAKTMNKLTDIIEFHQHFITYMEANNSCASVMINTQICTSALSIVLTLFMLLHGEWPGGYFYIVFCFVGLYLYCYLGTITEICNERIIDEIYNINWYNLTTQQQKLVRFMLMRSQGSQKIEVAGCMELSVSTGLLITKNIYSIFMMMVQFIYK